MPDQRAVSSRFRYDHQGARVRRWSTDKDGTRSWNWRLTVGRVQVQVTVHRHQYPTTPDRWVVQPHLVFDRKDR